MGKEGSKPSLALYIEDDEVWALPFWARALPLLQKNYEIHRIWLFEPKLVRLRGVQIPLWYLKTFGVSNFAKLGAFAVRRKLENILRGYRSFEHLCRDLQIEVHRGDSPNAEEVLSWAQRQQPDIGVIMVGHIIKPPLIRCHRIGMVNKHAAILPSCKGLFPYFWGVVQDEPLGVSFHVVDKEIDNGRTLLVKRYSKQPKDSMLRFYLDVFSDGALLLVESLSQLIEGRVSDTPESVEESYFSLPTRDDYRRFSRKGGRISRSRDLVYFPRSPTGHFEDCSEP